MALKPLYRHLRSLYRIFRKGLSPRDKILCLLIGAKSRLLRHFAGHDGIVRVRCRPHGASLTTISIRATLEADCFIAYEFLSGFYPPPDGTPRLIIDGGANIGLFLLHAATVFPSTPVICYEPDTKNLEMLRLNASQNGLSPDIRPLGLWSRSMKGYYHPKTAYDGHVSEEPSPYPVTCEVPPIHDDTWLKLDIEGAEYEVLPVLLSRQPLPRWISMEVHDWTRKGGALLRQLEACGYRCEILTDNSPEPFYSAVTASLPPRNGT